MNTFKSQYFDFNKLFKKNIKLTAFSTQSRTNNVGDAIILTDVSI